MGIPLTALNIQSDQPGPIDQYGRAMQLKQMLDAQKLMPGQMQLQQQQLEGSRLNNQAQTIANTQAQKTADDQAKIQKILEEHGSDLKSAIPKVMAVNPQLGIQWQKSILESDKTDIDQKSSLLDYHAKQAGRFAQLASGIKDQETYQKAIGDALKEGDIDGPTAAQLLSKPYDAATVEQIRNQALTAQQQIELKRNEITEQGAPLGTRVPQLNQGMTARYQVMNPGKPLPPEFTLPANATSKDFDRVDKLLQASESAGATKEQQNISNQIRQQMLELSKQSRESTQEGKDITSVIGQDPKTGKDVLVSQDEARRLGLTNVTKAGEMETGKARAARHWIDLADKNGKTPDTMGIVQLIDSLDKKGKLGTVASRWNEFLTGKLGSGDPEFEALRTKLGLSTTLLMNAHVGNRGGSYMMEHFEDLANGKKMDAQTLKSGILSELDYVKDRAMLPGGAAQGGGQSSGAKQPSGATHTGIGSVDKKKHWLDANNNDLGLAE